MNVSPSKDNPSILLMNVRSERGDIGFDLGLGYIAGALTEADFEYQLADARSPSMAFNAIEIYLDKLKKMVWFYWVGCLAMKTT